MPRLKRSKPNLRMLRLVVLVVVLVVIVLGVRRLACAGDPAGPSGPDGGTVGTVSAGSEITVSVGEPISAGGLTLVVTSLTATAVPTGPRYPMAATPTRSPRAGETYYQAFARAENTGAEAARVDPQDFSLDADGVLVGPEPSLSGPGARSLLQGASFDFILTFVGPEGLEPRLVYRARTGGTVIIEGDVAPDAFKQKAADGVSTTSLVWPSQIGSTAAGARASA